MKHTGEYTVLMVVARPGADVTRRRVCPTWDAPGTRAAGEWWTMPDVSPGQVAYHQNSTISLRVRFLRPQQDSNLRTRLRSELRYTAATSGNAA